jgi:hypothetical protein
MSSPERRRLNRLERRCDWLLARIAIGESKGRDMNRDIAEHSALRWLIDSFGAQYVDLVTENHALKQTIHNQRKEIRSLLARQHPGALAKDELEGLVDVVVASPSAAAPAEGLTHPLQEMPIRRQDQK